MIRAPSLMGFKNVLSLGFGFCLGLVAVRVWEHRKTMSKQGMVFEFGDTAESRAFLQAYPAFVPAFESLMQVGNKILGRESAPKSRADDICFDLAHTCRDD